MNSITMPSATEPQPAPDAGQGATVVITTFNHARYLAEAIVSVLAQTRPADEIIVVDDGSTDDPQAVVSRYPAARLIRQANQGLSAARNTGLAAAGSRYIVFLDADDLLLPRALELGLQAHREAPGTAFVYGGHRRANGALTRTGPDRYDTIGPSPFSALLRGNPVAMHGAVMFDRQILLDAGGYDTGLRRCEDYDVYLRLARAHPVASYAEPVAVYRLHGENMSGDRRQMLAGVLHVLDRHAASLAGPDAAAARDGRGIWIDYYAGVSLADAAESLRKKKPFAAAKSLLLGLNLSRRRMRASARSRVRGMLPGPVRSWIARLRRRGPIAPGRWRGGDFARGEPASQDFGWDRGQPVDRYYVEAFLGRHRADIAGRVLEVGDDAYSRRFGGDRVQQQDILHVREGNPLATLVGDLADPALLPAEAFDCLVLTQTLHLVYDLPAAVRNLHRALKPGGVALVTVPGISQVDRGEWGENWCWAIMPAAANRLFGDVFGPEGVAVASNGNFYAATSFLAGLAQAEIDVRKLDATDPAYPVVVSIRARKHA